MEFFDSSFFEWIFSIMRFASPLILVAMGGLLSERSGVINIALEGFILFGAFAGASAAHFTGHPWLSFAIGVSTGLGFGFVYAFLTVVLRSDQIVAGTALNMLAWGGIPFVGKNLFDSTASTPALELSNRLPDWAPVVLVLAAVAIVFLVLRYTRFGLWLTFAGEKPEALAAVGIRADIIRLIAVSFAGAFAASGGVILSMCLSSSYTRNMSAGRGFMALAALILGKWRPVPTCVACVLFGFCEVLQIRLQGTVIHLGSTITEIPGQIVQVIPYVLTLVLVAGFVGKSVAPRALGK